MNTRINLFLVFCLLIQILSIIPEWNLNNSGRPLVETDTEKTFEVLSKTLHGVKLVHQRIIKKDNSGISLKNVIALNDGEKIEVPFDQVESFYKLFEDSGSPRYIICPKGNHHPYDFTNKQDMIPTGFSGSSSWDLKCYLTFLNGSKKFFLVFYLMNDGNTNMYLTGTYQEQWYGEASLNDMEIYDYKLNNDAGTADNPMMALLKKTGEMQLILRYVNVHLADGSGQQYMTIKDNNKLVTNMKQFTRANFKSGYNIFYFYTYNSIDDFESGYTTQSTTDYTNPQNVVIKNNTSPHLEFLDDMIINDMNFMLNPRFAYYNMTNQKTGQNYYGIIDLELNKIIFNTNEQLDKFIPYNSESMLAFTKTKAYQICEYKNGDYCTEDCTNGYLLNIDGNTCGTTCPTGTLKFEPSGVCISQCDETLYYKSGTTCGLCKDLFPDAKYKFSGSNQCLNAIPSNAEEYNSKLHLLKCKDGYELNSNNECVLSCYKLCKTCSSFSDNDNDQKCNSCITGFDLDDKKNCRCPKGYSISGTTCNKCSNQCEEYDTNSCDCVKCQEGKYISNKRCIDCQETCKTCETEADNCLTCKDNYFYQKTGDKGECIECTSSTCQKTVDEENSCKCQECKDGYFVNNYRCFDCEGNCKTCEEKGKCLSCDEKHYYLENTECIKCSDNCKTAVLNTCKCASCEDGLYLENYHCLKCEGNCKTCEEKNKCLSCNNDYYLEEGECKKCSANCNTTVPNSCKCASCKENNFLFESGCYECINENVCESYKDDHCECKDCKSGYYKDKYSCNKCSDKCLTCNGNIENELNHHCLSCDNNTEFKYLLSNDSINICVDDCKNYNATLNTEKNICEFPTKKSGGESGNKDVDYMLWIFVGLIGLIIIVISICICKKCLCQKMDDPSFSDKIDEELDERELIN